ncbi:MAG TPA: Phenylacetic acid catabolic protein [Longimicrobiales bacterium]|nr:Phenylacetic acid catabolic protein [Longimicrobiales bacterium]
MASSVNAATDLDPEARGGLEDLLLVLADSKRLLGMRYAEWILGAPELEAGIACASMAQDEWGHARQMYAILKDFGQDPGALEHAREPGAYRNMAVLDRDPGSWAGLIALNLLADGALALQLDALRACAYEPLRTRCDKLLEEERFHAAHASAWARRFAGGGEPARRTLAEALEAVLPEVLRWFGPPGGRAAELEAAGVLSAHGDALRERLAARVRPVLEELGAAALLDAGPPSFDGFDEVRRRSGGGGPDPDTVARVRGDRNRAFLMD